MDYDHLEDEIGIKKEAVLFKKGFFHITTCLSAIFETGHLDNT